MLQLSASLIGKSVLSLRTGQAVATVISPVINPNNLKVEGFYCRDSINKKILILLDQDIREQIKEGFVVNDHDVLAEESELVRLREVLNLKFELLGKPVETTSKDRVGKISDYAVETDTMFIQKLYVSQSLLKSLTGGSLSVDRNQIHEITKRRIIINDLLRDNAIPAPAAIA